MQLTAEKLTQSAFQPFGDVIETANKPFISINDGNAERYHNLAQLDLLAQSGEPLVSVFRARPYPKPLLIKMMERHPLSSQAFYPLTTDPFLVLVAPADEEPTAENMRLFVTNGSQGVNFHRGVWHHPLLVLVEQQDFLVIDRGGKEKNCDEVFFTESFCEVTI